MLFRSHGHVAVRRAGGRRAGGSHRRGGHVERRRRVLRDGGAMAAVETIGHPRKPDRHLCDVGYEIAALEFEQQGTGRQRLAAPLQFEHNGCQLLKREQAQPREAIMQLPHEQYGVARIVKLGGRVDHDNAEDFKAALQPHLDAMHAGQDRKSTRLNSSHSSVSRMPSSA